MLSIRLITIVVAVCLVPPLMQLLGVDFSTPKYEIYLETFDAETEDFAVESLMANRGLSLHSLIEWTGVCLAFMAVVLSLVHYALKRDVTTPVIATALSFAAMLDAFRVLAINDLVASTPDPESFTLVTWALSRLFLITLLVSGTIPFLFRTPFPQRVARDFRDFMLLAVAYALAAFLIIYYAGQWLVFSDDPAIATALSRRVNFVALMIYAVVGSIVLTYYNSRYGGIFATALVASLLPHSIAQLYATFGSERLYDAGFHLASIYKLLGYLVPVVGLIVDYRRASNADSELASTERQLDIARDIQTSLLPTQAPAVENIDVAGYSVACEAVGGDYFDYIKLPDGSLLVVVADVSGHDLGAALLTANARAYIRAWAEGESDVAVILRSLNTFVSADAGGRRFITAMLVSVPAEGPISVVCAGHVGYIVAAGGTYKTLQQKNAPLGVIDELDTESLEAALAEDDTLVLVTDGVLELPDKAGNQFGIERVSAIIRDCRGESAATMLDRVRAEANLWAGTTARSDDMTLVLVKRS